MSAALDVVLTFDARPAIDSLRRLSRQATFLSWFVVNDPTMSTNLLGLRRDRL